jgi:hypothetical protein
LFYLEFYEVTGHSSSGSAGLKPLSFQILSMQMPAE